ncbi:ATP-binding protein [Pigmentiphaga aceris]|uniref:ATP-binding protein n=1 Tax=Pigmentiphaga aceris TaxID=1940612 RepID=A0A5C0ATH3_9BURK|nr:ATP-binding protein [Pigmentiphaga aceris]QEI05669.1 ATP-binding protein [Pigmentiphaga aceris]
MNRLALQNLFKRDLDDLLNAVEWELTRLRDPFAHPDPDRRPHEHDTRLIFVDKLLDHLGWRRGAGGNVLEEARLQADTTKFMDYVGVVDISGSPLLLVEAKAWDKPAISARGDGQYASEAALLVVAIQHIRDGKSADTSPVIAEWDSYLRQVSGYVKTIKEQYFHDLPRAVIISGEWMVVFSAPVQTFLRAGRPDDIAIFPRSQFKAQAEHIFELLHRSALTQDAPVPLRPAQLRQFLELSDVEGAFQGVHVHYERTGSKLFARRPRILIYPALFVARKDNAVFTVIDNDTAVELDYRQDNGGVETLSPHLDEIRARGAALIAACGTELGGVLSSAELSAFPGFRRGDLSKAPVGGLTEPDEWLVATGSGMHFLLEEPRVQGCRFHSWAECGADAAMQSAISVRSVTPPAFFVDSQRHHCAHQVVQDRRAERCLIQAIDSRTCCQACVFFERCWTQEERVALPCGR